MFKAARSLVKMSMIVGVALPLLFLSGGRVIGDDGRRPVLLLPLGHSKNVNSVALSLDGKRSLTGSDDHTAILWDIEIARPLQTFKGHTSSVTSVALSVDGKRVLTGSDDRTAILWDIETARPLQTFKGHTDWVMSVALSVDGKRVLTGSHDTTSILWDAETAKPVQTFKGHTNSVRSVALSGDSKRVLTGSGDGTAILWDIETARPLQTFKGHTNSVKPTGFLGAQVALIESLKGDTNSVTSVALSGDGKRVLTGSLDGTAILWDAETAKPVQTFKGHTHYVMSVALNVDGKRVLTGSFDDTAILWDAETAKPVQTFNGHASYVTSVALSGDGKWVLTGSWGNTAILWDIETARPIKTFKGHTTAVRCVASSGDGKRVLTGSFSAAILWDVETVAPLHTFKEETNWGTSVALTVDGKRVLTASGDKTAILVDAETDRPLKTFKGHTEGVPCVALSVDGKRVLTGSWDKTAILWDIETARPLQTFKGHTAWVRSVALSGDGKRVLTGSSDGTAILWDAETAAPLQTFKGHTSWVSDVALSGDGKWALTGSGDDTAILWDAETAKPVQTFGHAWNVNSVALSVDGKRVLTASLDNAAILWDAETARPLQMLRGHAGVVTYVGFAAGGSLVITASEDGTVRVWVPGRQESLFAFLRVGDEWLAWTPEGYYTCSPNGESLIAWKVDGDSPGSYRIVGPDQFRKTFYRPDLFPYLFHERDLTRALALADKERGGPAEPPTTIARALPPNIDLLRPERDGDTEEETLTVEAHAFNNGEYPVTRLRLLIDGRPYQGALSAFEVPDPRPGRVKRSWQVELEPGDHTIQVLADSAVSDGRSDIVRIRRKAIRETLPRLFVLAVGISEYDNEGLRKDVYYAAADARKFCDTVERSSKPLYREVSVIRLIDRDATRRKVLQGLANLKKQATQRDAVMIYFAGHGTRDDQGNFYFLPVEAELADLAATGLSEGDFKAQVKALSGRVILLLDACHSGTLIENRGRSAGDGPIDRIYRDLTSNEYGLVMMCSSKGQEKALESPQHKGGYFTVALVEGLGGKARLTNGAVYLKALDDYVTERVKELSKGEQHPLTSQPSTISNIPLTKP